MNCQQYLFKLTSGQLQDAPASERMQAALHRLVCRHCRDFSHNDAMLDQALGAWRARLQEAPPAAPPDGDAAPPAASPRSSASP